MERDEQFLRNILESLVDEPERIEVGRTVDEMGVLLTVKCAPNDMGKIIGRQGATAKAIRTMLRVVGSKNSSRINLKIQEPENSERKLNRERVRKAFAGVS